MARNSTYFRIAAIAAVLGLLVFWILWHGAAKWQFEEIDPGVLYRAGLRDQTEFINSCTDSHCRGMVLIASPGEIPPALREFVDTYCFRNNVRRTGFAIAPSAAPTAAQIRTFFEQINSEKRRPMLILCPSGERAAMLAAAYRLSVLQIPLDKALVAIDATDLSPSAKSAVRDFASRYAAALQKASTSPAAPPAP